MTSSFILAVAQGIIAQARVLGGSLGIAASSAILSRKADVAGSPRLGLLQHGGSAGNDVSEQQRTLAREIYPSAFTDDMYVGLGMAALGAICAIAIYRKKRHTIIEHRTVKIGEEIKRRRDRYAQNRMVE